jgi:hypothetical protein
MKAARKQFVSQILMSSAWRRTFGLTEMLSMTAVQGPLVERELNSSSAARKGLVKDSLKPSLNCLHAD